MVDGKASRALGFASIGLGAAEVLAPRWIDRKLGLREHPVVTRVVGVRDVISGIGTVAHPASAAWGFARLAGDALRAGLLGASVKASRRRALVLGALGVIVALGILDALTTRAHR